MAYTSVKVTASSSEYQAQMKQAAIQMKSLSAEFVTAQTKAKLFGSETDLLETKTAALTQKITLQKEIVKGNSEQHERLSQRLAEQKTKQEQLASKVDDAKKAYKESTEETGKNSEKSKALKEELSKLESELKASETAIGKTETALGKQTVATESSKTKLMEMESELEKVNKELKDHKLDTFSTACDSAGQKMENFGKKMTVVSAGIIALGGASISAFNEVDDGMDGITSATGATGEELAGLESAYENVASTFAAGFGDIGSTLGEVNNRFNFTGKAAEDCTKKFLEFAKVNNTDAVTAVQLVSRAMGDAGIDASEYESVLDKLTASAQTSGISIDSLATNLAKYGAPMRALGLTTDESIAIFAGWEKAGVNTEIAFSGMKKAISNWASDGKDARVEFKRTLEEIAACPDIASATTKAIEVFGQKAGPDLADAIKGGRFEYSEMLQVIENSSGTLENTYGNIIDANDDAVIAMNNAKLAAAEFGSTILSSASPIIQDMSGKLKTLTAWFSGLSEEQKETILKTGLLVAAIAPLTIGIGKVAQGVSSTVKAYKDMRDLVGGVIAKLAAKTAATTAEAAAETASTVATTANATATSAGTVATVAHSVATKAAAAAQGLLNAAFVSSPIGWVVLVVGALVAGFIALYKNSETVRNAVNKLWTGMKDAFGKIAETTSSAFNKVKETMGTVLGAAKETVKEKLDNIKNAYTENGGGIKGVVAAGWEGIKGYYTAGFTFVDKLTGGKLTAIKNQFTEKLTAAKQAVSDKLTSIKESFTNAFNSVKDAVSTALQTIKNVITVGFLVIKEVVTAAASIIMLPYQFIWENCKGLVIAAFEVIKGKIQTVFEEIKAVITTALTAINEVFTIIWNAISLVVTTVLDAVKLYITTTWNAISLVITTVLGAIKTVATTVWNAISLVVTTIMNAIKFTLTTVWNAISQTIITVMNAIRMTITLVWNSISSTVMSVVNAIRGTISSVFSTIQSITSSAWSAVQNSITSAVTSAKNTVSSVFDAVQSKISSTVDSVKSKVESTFNAIKSAIEAPINEAKNTVSSAIETMKNKFNFSWSLPHLKMPHFNISGEFSLNPPKVPSFGVSWWKTGGIMTSSMIFGMNGNTMLGGGEAGAEAILPLETFYTRLNSMLDKKLAQISNINNFIIENHTYMDSDEISSKTYTKVNDKMIGDYNKRR